MEIFFGILGIAAAVVAGAALGVFTYKMLKEKHG